MSKKEFRAFLIIFAGILIMTSAYYVFIWVTSLSIVHWLIIFFCFLGLIFVRRRHKEKQLKMIAEERRRKLERQAKLEVLIKMGSREFEEYICDLFIEIGFDAILTPQTRDGGKDLMIYKDDLFAVVECKKYNHTNKVSVTSIRNFHSVIMDSKADKGLFITTSEFTGPAMSYAIDKPIILMNGENLIKIIQGATNEIQSTDIFSLSPSLQ